MSVQADSEATFAGKALQYDLHQDCLDYLVAQRLKNFSSLLFHVASALGQVDQSKLDDVHKAFPQAHRTAASRSVLARLVFEAGTGRQFEPSHHLVGLASSLGREQAIELISSCVPIVSCGGWWQSRQHTSLLRLEAPKRSIRPWRTTATVPQSCSTSFPVPSPVQELQCDRFLRGRNVFGLYGAARPTQRAQLQWRSFASHLQLGSFGPPGRRLGRSVA